MRSLAYASSANSSKRNLKQPMFFQLVSPRYERASLIITSNKPPRPLG